MPSQTKTPIQKRVEDCEDPHVTRKTSYPDGTELIIIDRYFHDYPQGSTVTVWHADRHSYHVKGVNLEGKFSTYWVKEDQVTPVGQYVPFETGTGLKAAFYPLPNGEYKVKVTSKVGRSQYYSALNEAGLHFEETILPHLLRKHPSQENEKA